MSFALFDTVIGTCGIAWTERGITRVQLPAGGAADTVSRLRRHDGNEAEDVPPTPVQHAITEIRGLLDGTKSLLGDIALDMTGVPEFERRVYESARLIPPGETMTYGALATRIGASGAAQAVGKALGANPFPLIVPCHRIVGANGKLTGFSAPGGVATKRRLLRIEGARVVDELDLFE